MEPGRRRVALVVLLLTALLVPSSAWADARDDARRSFRQGMAQIAEGKHLEGAKNLERAYEILPHPNVLYNIGLAYADAGDFETAIDYFERYVSDSPGDTSAVQRLIEVLKTQQEELKATGSAQAKAATGGSSAAGDGGASQTGGAATGQTSDGAAADDGAGDGAIGTTVISTGPEAEALMRRLEALADRLEGKKSAEIDPTAEVLDEGTLEQKSGDIYEEVVVSASRQATSPVNAPIATTIITAEQIRLSGATSIPEALRRVPGMSILTMGSANTNVAMRGFNQRLSNKMLVLVDGRSVYLDFLGTTFFRTLTIDLQDVERIEIIRGPGSTLYGANAFGGVVNIITKQASSQDIEGQVHLVVGSGDTLAGSARVSGQVGLFDYKASVGYEQTERYEREYGERSDFVATTEDEDLALRAIRANAALRVRPTSKISLGLQGGVNYGFNNFFAIGVLRDYWLQGLFTNARLDAQFGGLGIRAFWNYFDAEFGPTWEAVGAPSLLGSSTQNVVDVEAVYSGTAKLGPIRQDLAVGAGYRLKTIRWTYLDGPHLEQHLSGFVEDRITFVPQFVTVLGFRFDHHPLIGFTPSPRGAVLIKPTPRQAIRLSAGTAFRTPTFLESYLETAVPTGSATAVSIVSRGDTGLDPENILAIEGGYVFEDSDFFSFSVEGYYQRVSQLIALGPVTPFDEVGGIEDEQFLAGTSTYANGEGVFHGFGGEAAVHAFPLDGLDIRLNYSFAYFIDQAKQDAGEDDVRDKRHPMHTANIGASYRSPIGLDGNVDVHIVSDVVVPERSFDPASGAVVVEDCAAPAYAMVNARVGYRLLQDRLEFGVTAFNIGAWADGGHREHCLATKVGPRVLGTATYRF